MNFADQHAVLRQLRFFQFFKQARALRVRFQNAVDQRFVGGGRVLRDGGDAFVFGKRRRAFVGGEIARNNAEKRRFAASVRADQPDFLSVGNERRSVVKENAGAETHGDIFYVEHDKLTLYKTNGLNDDKMKFSYR